jgi:UMF1 family MFS transporter
MTAPAISAPGIAPATRAPLPALAGWALLEWAAQPFYTLITTFLFAPYFANVFIGDAVRGQALWGYAAAAAGLGVAITTPILGAIADASGRRKPWMLGFAFLLAAATCALWIAAPGKAGLALPVMLAFIVAAISAECIAVFANSIMPTLVPQRELGRLSGIGWATGYLGGLVSLLIMAGLIVTNPATGKTLLGLTPLLKLDAVAREGDRLVGPFSAAWLLLFVIPFFLFTPEPRSAGPARGIGAALGEFKDTIKSLPRYRNILLFLIARMIYVDGLTAIFAFGGIYGASVYGWSAFELGLFGIILTVVGVIGALVGGFLDDKLGSVTVIVGTLLLVMVGAIGILSIDKTHVLFTTLVPEKVQGSAPFSSMGERVFLAFAILIGLVAAPVQASSRSLMARLAPAEKMTQFFGLFAFSGKVTAFAAPLAVGAVTTLTGSQRAGIAVIVVFLALGLLMMLGVRTRPAE